LKGFLQADSPFGRFAGITMAAGGIVSISVDASWNIYAVKTNINSQNTGDGCLTSRISNNNMMPALQQKCNDRMDVAVIPKHSFFLTSHIALFRLFKK